MSVGNFTLLPQMIDIKQKVERAWIDSEIVEGVGHLFRMANNLKYSSLNYASWYAQECYEDIIFSIEKDKIHSAIKNSIYLRRWLKDQKWYYYNMSSLKYEGGEV